MLAVAATLSATAFARPITLSFNGTVTQTSFDPFDPLAGAVGVGSDFCAHLHFDTDMVDAASSLRPGAYTHSNSPFGLVAVAGPVLFPQMGTVGGPPCIFSATCMARGPKAMRHAQAAAHIVLNTQASPESESLSAVWLEFPL